MLKPDVYQALDVVYLSGLLRTAGYIYLLHAFVLTTIHGAADHIPDPTRVFTYLAAPDGVHRQLLGKLTA